MPDVRELSEGEERAAVAALLELRPHCGPPAALQERVRVQFADGYRIAASFEDGDREAAAVAGFRAGENLAWGRFVYIDDLVCRPALRGRGHAEAVMRWVHDEAVRLECDQLHLDSGVGPERHTAHALYFRLGLRISSHHFQRPVA